LWLPNITIIHILINLGEHGAHLELEFGLESEFDELAAEGEFARGLLLFVLAPALQSGLLFQLVQRYVRAFVLQIV
jgi:hypothetical protein